MLYRFRGHIPDFLFMACSLATKKVDHKGERRLLVKVGAGGASINHNKLIILADIIPQLLYQFEHPLFFPVHREGRGLVFTHGSVVWVM